MRLVDDGRELAAHYSDRVRDVVRIRKDQLVAVDQSPAQPEIAWRWFLGEVTSRDGDLLTVRRADLPEGAETAVSAGTVGAAVAAGDFVYYTGGDAPQAIALAIEGVPSDAAWVATTQFPRIAGALQA